MIRGSHGLDRIALRRLLLRIAIVIIVAGVLVSATLAANNAILGVSRDSLPDRRAADFAAKIPE